jgi:hypothetical protein
LCSYKNPGDVPNKVAFNNTFQKICVGKEYSNAATKISEYQFCCPANLACYLPFTPLTQNANAPFSLPIFYIHYIISKASRKEDKAGGGIGPHDDVELLL